MTTATTTIPVTLAITNAYTTKPRTHMIKAGQAQEGYFPASGVRVARGWSLQTGILRDRTTKAYNRHSDRTYIHKLIHGTQRVQYLAKPNAGCARFRKEMDQTKHLRPQQRRMLGDRCFDVTKLMSNFVSPKTSQEIGATS